VSDDDRSREEAKRDRQMIELLNELRVALPGVQILFAFLLTVPFANRFPKITDFQRDVFYITLVATTVSAACLIAPSAAHRLRFHKQERMWLIESANVLLIAGLAFLAVAIGAAFLLVTDLLFDGPRVWIYSAVIWVIILALWFGRPLSRQLRGLSSGP
jgi:cobalamin synthase